MLPDVYSDWCSDHVLVGVMLADVAALVGTADVVLGSADLQVFSPWSQCHTRHVLTAVLVMHTYMVIMALSTASQRHYYGHMALVLGHY